MEAVKPVKLNRFTLSHITTEDLHAVWKRKGSGLTERQVTHTGMVKLEDLYTAPAVFQPRDKDEYPDEYEGHLRRLTKHVRDGGKLDKIAVFPIAGLWLVTDGHMRREAYKRAGRNYDIPIVCVKGGFNDALIYATSANRKDKLRMSGTMKSESAWKLVKWNKKMHAWTMEQIARDTGRSSRLVKKMAATLRNQTLGFDPCGESWRAVCAKMNSTERKQWTDEEIEEEVQRIATKLRKAAAPWARKPQSDILAEAIQRAFPATMAKQEAEDEAVEGESEAF